MPRTAAEVNQLFEDHLGLYHSCIRHFVRKYPGMPREEVISLIGQRMTEALYLYDPDRGQLSTLVYRIVSNGLSKYCRYTNALRRRAVVVSIDQPMLGYDSTTLADMLAGADNTEDLALDHLTLDQLTKALTDEERLLAAMCYGGLPQREMACKLGISQVSVSRRLQKLRTKLTGGGETQKCPVLSTILMAP